jgi:hypothetical protein
MLVLAVVGQKTCPNTTVHTTVQRGKKFAGGETIDLQSLRGRICVVEGDRVGVTRLDTGGLWRRIRLVSGDPQTQDPLIPEYHIRATQ